MIILEQSNFMHTELPDFTGGAITANKHLSMLNYDLHRIRGGLTIVLNEKIYLNFIHKKPPGNKREVLFPANPMPLGRRFSTSIS
jgi:hypothetical protein